MSKTLTKADIVDHLIAKSGLQRNQAKDLTETFFEELSSSLEKGEDIKLSGFGNFNIRHKSQRPGRNPKTKEAAVVSERTVVTFKAGPKLSGRIINSTV